MLVRERMSTKPVTITADVPITEALRVMRENQVRRLPVLDPERANAPESVAAIRELAADLFVVCDEVYREFVFDGGTVRSFTEFTDLAQRIVVVDSVSKRFNACGVRIGCMASKNAELIDLRTIHSFDPCMACGVHIVDAQGKELTRVELEGRM